MNFDNNKIGNAFNLIEGAINKGTFPCAAAAIGNKQGFSKVYIDGDKGISPYNQKLEYDSVFDMASLTKVIATNTLFMLMLEQGKISVYDKISNYIKGFTGDGKENINIFNILTHTSGLPSFVPFYLECKDYEDSIRYICSSVPITNNNDVQYSDLNYILLGRILEILGGETLDTLCKKMIFNPLHMENTGFNLKGRDFVPTEIDRDTKKIICGTVHDENARFFNGVSGHAGLFSNINDMVKFANMLMNEGKVQNEVFLSKPLFKRMVRNYTENLNENRGLGWSIKGDKISSGGDLLSPSAFGHTGYTGTSLWVDPEYGVYIILLTNRVHPHRDNVEIIRFRRLFHNTVMASLEDGYIL